MRHYRLSITTACVLVAGALTWGVPARGNAQATEGNAQATKGNAQATKTSNSGTFTAAAEVGGRGFTTEPSDVDKGRLELYRSLPNGALLERGSLRFTPADSMGRYQLVSRRLGQIDQSLWLEALMPKLYDFNVRWDRMPHLYSSTARSPGDEGGTILGLNSLPTPRPDTTAWKNAPYIGNIRTIWDPVKTSFALRPTEALDTKFDWLRIGKKGNLPKSISFSGSGGPSREYVSPIDETVNNFRIAQSYTSGLRDRNSALGEIVKSVQGTIAYQYSKYHNEFNSVLVDNPALSTPVALTYNPTTQAYTCPTGTVCGTNTARVGLPPSNTASTISLMGAVLLPLRTRLVGSVNTSIEKQNEPFLPQFNNTALAATDPNLNLLANQRPSLEGKVDRRTFNFAATSHPITNLTLGAKYRNYDYSNKTPEGRILAMVVSDRATTLGDSARTEWDPFTKVNGDFSAAYQVIPNGSVSVGYGIENFTREPGVFRADGSHERTPRVAVDYGAFSWLSLRGSYMLGHRKYTGTYTEAPTEVSDMRSYMFADRNRARINLMATITPFDPLSVGLSYQNGEDKYGKRGQRFGLMSDKTITTGVDADYTPIDRLSLTAGYTHEKTDAVDRFRYRTGAVGSVTYDNPAYYWTTTNADRNTTGYGNVRAVLIPEKLELTGGFSVIDSKFHMFNVNDQTPTGGTAAQNLSATVENWPEVTTRLTPINLAVQYRVTPEWGLTLGFNSEKYANNNFQFEAPTFTSTTLAGGPPITSWTGDLPGNVGATAGTNTGQFHFLGNNYHPYTARWFTLLFSYNPSFLPFRSGRSAF
jgi:MtrB/PioB family decaheme-associated outer membrane protein